jgi:hypothetical protein
MNRAKRVIRDKEILKYRFSATLFETAVHFDLSLNQVALIEKKLKREIYTLLVQEENPVAPEEVAKEFGLTLEQVEKIRKERERKNGTE